MTLRSPLVTAEIAQGGVPNVRAPLFSLEAQIGGVPNVRAPLFSLEAQIGGLPRVRSPLVALEVLTLIPVVVVPPPIYPTLPGLEYPIGKRATWSTQMFEAVSGLQSLSANYPFPIWEFTLSYSGLASNGAYPGLSTDSLQTLEGFYNDMYGRYSSFLFQDTTDCQVTNGYIGTGDGTTAVFTLTRTLRSIVNEPVGWVLAGALTGVSIGGTALPSTAYTLIAPNQVSFTSAPAAGAVITATFSFYFLCGFKDDKIDFDQFMNNLWENKSVVLRSRVQPASS